MKIHFRTPSAIGLLSAVLLISSLHISAASKLKDPDEQPDSVYRWPLVTASKLVEAPAIDGKVGKAEWTRAARSAPMVRWRGEGEGLLTDDLACYWIGYTDEALFLAWRFDRPPYAIIPKSEGKFDGNWGDDKIEVMLRPKFQHGEQGYNLVINAKGVRADRLDHNINWNGDWTAAARVTDKGWEGELSISFKTMERARPAAGEMWEILILRNRRTPENVIAINSYIHKWPGYPHYGYLRFGAESEPAVRVLEAGPIDESEAGMTIEFVTGDKAAPVKVEAALLLGPEGSSGFKTEVTVREEGLLVPKQVNLNFFDAVAELGFAKVSEVMKQARPVDRQIDLDPDRTVRIPLRVKVPHGSHSFVYRVRDAASGKLIAGGAVPFQQKPLFDVTIDNYLLVAKGLKVTADYRRMPEATEKCRVVAELIDPADSTVVATTSEAVSPKQGRMERILATPERFEKTYIVRNRVVDAEGKTLTETSREVQLPARPVWLDNKIGDTDEPLPGWKAIQLDGDFAKVVLRNYQVAPSGLPSRIVSREKSLLAGPIELLVGGKTLSWSRRLESQSDGKVIWRSVAKAEGLEVTIRTTLEYDGLLIYELALSPEDKPVDLSRLLLHIPYRRELARFRRVIGNKGHNFIKDGPLKFFQPGMEVGDLDTGLDFWCEWDRHWHVGNQPYAEMNESGAALNWIVRIIGDQPKTISRPVNFTFALQALPVREVDASYQYDQRHAHSGIPSMIPRYAKLEDFTHCDLRYPLEGNVSAEKGSVVVRLSHLRSTRLFSIGEGKDAICAGYARPFWKKYVARFFLYYGTEVHFWQRDFRPQKDQIFCEVVEPPLEDGWSEVSLGWHRQGDKVRLTLGVRDALGETRTMVSVVPFDRWTKAFDTGSLIVGGGSTVIVDHVLMCAKDQPAGRLLAALREPGVDATKTFSVVDPIDRLRFYRGGYLTVPQHIISGKGGVASARYWGVLARQVAGKSGKAVYLPSFEEHDQWDIGKALKIKYVFPIFEQFHGMLGYYGQNYVENPAWVEHFYRKTNRRGFDTMIYTTFGAHPKYDKHYSPFAEELSRKPKGLVYTAVYPSLGTPAQDYIVWSVKKMIDEYNIRALHEDNTIAVREPDHDVFTGHGFYDENGKLHGRWHLFASRRLAKKLRWLTRVYVPDGFQFLGHGARRFPLVAGFVDVTASGEGGFFYKGDWDKLMPPEDYPDSLAYRVGVPHETLTKGGEHRFSPNMTFMYMLLNNGSLRMSSFHINPGAWWVNPEDKNPSPYYRMRGSYNPYFARSNTGWVAAPMALYWMIQDDMNLREAEFIPFWRVGEWMTLEPKSARCSFHLRKGHSALLIVANTTGQPAEATIKLDLEKMGLSGLKLVAYDALTDDPYELEGGTLKLKVPKTI
ncbi:MAG: DUF6067 family protein, partial [Planctomycetota bacterium]|nr:DUF6067 family protein [Planctomycetota bacterium]